MACTADIARCGTFALAIMLTLGGCGSGSDAALLTDYSERLQRTLQLELADAAPAALNRIPPKRELRYPQNPGNIGLLDLWALRSCELQRVIADKNSSLGRVAMHSTELFYELAFLRLYPACHAHLETDGDTKLARQLQLVAEEKRQRLPQTVWQALLGGPEYRAYWSSAQRPGGFQSGSGASAQQSFAALNQNAQRWLQGDYRVDRDVIEEHLRVIRGGGAGSLYRKLLLQERYLGQLDRAISVRLEEGKICPSPGVKTASILDNVVRKYFIAALQPWSVRLQTGVQQLVAAQALELLLAANEPVAFKEWRQRRDAHLIELAGAPRRHVAALLPVMEQCGLAPG